MTIHLCNNGFMLGYERWTSHGESVVPENVEHDNVGDGDRMNDMLVDAIVAEGVSKVAFKCDPLEQEKAEGVLEKNLTRKVKQMLHEEKAAAIKRLQKKGKLPIELTEVDEDGNRWPTKEALISAKRVDFSTDDVVHTLEIQKLKTGKDPGISGAWLHTHNLYRGTDQERICSQRTADRWEDFDKAMKNAHGENWEEEHPDLDGQIIYEAAGRMPHGRLGIANELFSKKEKVKFKYKRVMASEPVRSAREDRLERENKHLKRENKRLRGIELVVQSLAEKGGVDFDGIMQSAATDLGMGSRTGGSTSHGNDDEDDYYDNEGDDNYVEDDLYGDEQYDNYGDDGYNDYEDGGYNDYGHGDVDWP
ncbi:hypothetical protein D1007_49984 [Hordeum vulgare]|nr:hypothetical protein D1007_49984 [Hordeum vulgare]